MYVYGILVKCGYLFRAAAMKRGLERFQLSYLVYAYPVTKQTGLAMKMS